MTRRRSSDRHYPLDFPLSGSHPRPSVPFYAFWLIALCLIGLPSAWAESNISTTNKYAFSENAGWLNWRSTNAQAMVYTTYLSGYVWSESVGWIKLGATPSGSPPRT